MGFIFELVVIFLMVVFNAVFAAYEMALASISRVKLQVLANQKKRGARDALFMKDRMEASLAVVQVGITFVGAIAAATGGAGVAESLAPYFRDELGLSRTFSEVLSLLFLIIPLSLFTIIFAELIPKTYALNNKVWICLTFSPFIKVMFRLGYPVILLIEKIVQGALVLINKNVNLKERFEEHVGLHELTAAVSLARASRLMGAREEKIVLSAAQLSIRHIKEIMLPIADVSMIPINISLTEALIRAHLDMHTRFPVCGKEGDPQSVEGYINFKDIMMALKLNPSEPSIKGIVRPIKSVQEDAPISQVLEQMIQDRMHITLVVSQSRKFVGMVTMVDIMEELVGEIEDEFDRLPIHIHPYGDGGGWIVGGGVSMKSVFQTVGIDKDPALNDLNWRLTDWCLIKLKGKVQGGEVIESDGLRVVIRKLRRKKISEVALSRL